MSKEAKTADEAARIADLSWEVSKIEKERNFQQPSQRQTQPGYENNQRQARPLGQNREQGKNFDATRFRNPKPPFQNSRPFNGKGRNEYVHRGARFSGGKQGSAFFVNKMHSNNAADCDAMSYCDDVDDVCVNLCNDKRNDEWLDDKRFIIPVYIGEVQTRALRDTGCQIAVIVDERFIKPEQLDYSRTVLCSGAFDNGLQRSLPTAEITMGSPRFGSNEHIKIRAAVARLPKGVPCVIGNQFFAMNSHLTDILEVKNVTDAERGENEAEPALTRRPLTSQTGHSRNDSIINDHRANKALEQIDERAISEKTDRCPVNAAAATAADTPASRQSEGGDHSATDNATGATATFQVSTQDRQHAVTSDAQCNIAVTLEANTLPDCAAQVNEVITRAQAKRNSITDMAPTSTPDMTINNTPRRDDRSKPTLGNSAHSADAQVQALESKPETRPTDDRQNELDVTAQALSELANINIDLRDDQFSSETDSVTAFRTEHRKDSELQDLWGKASQNRHDVKVINGLLYRKIPVQINSEHDFALVVPAKYQKQIIRAAHDQPTAGHYGTKHTE